MTRPLAIAAGVLLLVVLRMALPFHEHPSMLVYSRMVWALFGEANWGRQALVGVLEYPPAPTACLLVLEGFARVLRGLHLPAFAAEHLLVAICQAWTFTYLVRLAGLFHTQRWRFLVAAILMAVLLGGSGALDANPFWVYLVMLSSMLFHLCRWEMDQSLRDVVVVAMNCGLLMFGGFIGVLFAGVTLLTVWLRGRRSVVHEPGGAMLLWMPAIYILLLYPLFNWLIMEDPLFFIKHFVGQFQTEASVVAMLVEHWRMLALLALLAAVVMALPRVPLYTRLGFNLALVVGAVAALRQEALIYIGGEFLLATFVLLPLLLFFLFYESAGFRGVLSSLALMVLIMVPITATVQLRGSARNLERFAEHPPPPAGEEILAKIDKLWPRGRVLVYDLRAAAIYSADYPQRFVAQLDFNEDVLLGRLRAEDEQLHLLVPPNNGRFYSAARSPLARIHAQKPQRWLLLEETWPGGWLLFTCVPQNDESIPLPSIPR